jgi:hypothetical protein
MNLEQRLRESLVAPDPGAAFTARVMTRMTRGRARRGRRIIVIGAVLVAGVAAAMLAVQLTASRTPVAVVADPVQVESPVTVSSAAMASTGAEVRAVEPEQPAAKSAQHPMGANGDPARIRILMMPARHESQDTAARPAIEAFHSSLLQALRNTPGVVVEVVEPGSASDHPANRVTVVSPRYITRPSGLRAFLSGDGRRNWSESGATKRGPKGWPVEVMLKLAIQKTAENSVSVDQFIDSNGIPNRQSCSSHYHADIRDQLEEAVPGGASPATSNEFLAMCSSAEGLAAMLVAALQPKAPRPTADTAQLIARLSDASSHDRPGAFRELIDRVRRNGVGLDAAAIKAITTYFDSLVPEQRLSNMFSLRGLRQPGLIPPLLDVVKQDGDEKVRLEALSILIGDYGGDRRVRSALETVVRQDASPFIRMIAQRPLSGDAQWQTYVETTLADKSLSTADRLAPAQYDLRQSYAPGATAKVPSYLGSDFIARQLVEIFHDLRAAPRQPQAVAGAGNASPDTFIPSNLVERMAELGATPGAGRVVQLRPGEGALSGSTSGSGAVTPATSDGEMQSVLTVLTMANPSAAIDLRIRILTEPPPPPTWLGMNSLNALMGKRDDPRVGKVLDDIAAGKLGPELRGMLERNLAMRPQSATSTVR